MELKVGIADLLDAPHKLILEREILPAYLKRQRWFASKDQEIKAVRLVQVGVVEFAADRILLCEVEVELLSRSERYQLPLGLSLPVRYTSPFVEGVKIFDATVAGVPCVVTDAFSLDNLVLGLHLAMQRNDVLLFSHSKIHCFSHDGFDSSASINDVTIKRLSGEQSNSSLVIGGTMIMKLIRRVTTGINPEFEMVRYLTENGYQNTPPVLGAVEHVRFDGSSYSMWIVQKFIASQGDAWAYTLDFLQSEPDEFGSYEQFIAALGIRLAELHEILSHSTSKEAFAPLKAAEKDVMEWSAAAYCQVQSAFAVLENDSTSLKSNRENRDFLISYRDKILNALPKLAQCGIGALMTRIHGDFHLGQVLVSNGDAFIIDFEGEPSKPLESRRSKSSPMRDVAGLLRSLDYAASASGAQESGFAEKMSVIFLMAYRSVLTKVARPWVDGIVQQSHLLDLFQLEKCAYEICYEAANRPSWVDIPLRSFADISARILQTLEMVDA